MTVIIENLDRAKSKRKKKIYDKDLPKIPFTMAFIGPSRSGKSNVIKNLLLNKKYYAKAFEYIFIFCPSIDLNDDFDDIKSSKKIKVEKFNTFDQNIIEEIFEQQVDLIKEHGKKKAPDILLIFDDVFDNVQFTNSALLKTLAMRGRHACVSMMLSGQKLSLLGTPVRNNLTHLVFFRPNNLSELDRFLEENVQKTQRKEYSKAFKDAWQTEYNFILVDYLNGDLKMRFREGFSTPLPVEW